MKRNINYMWFLVIIVFSMLIFGGMSVYSAESIAAAIPQAGGLNALAYTTIGLVLAGVGFMVRKKI